jgi:hypothetical protein
VAEAGCVVGTEAGGRLACDRVELRAGELLSVAARSKGFALMQR